MKINKKILWIILAVLAVFAGGLGFYLRSQDKGEGLQIRHGDVLETIDFKDLGTIEFSGEFINGKGEVSEHSYLGMELSVLLQKYGITVTDETRITAESEDHYTAEVSGAEVNEPGKVYVAVTADGKMIENIDGMQGAQLVVMGDSNAKRQVRYLKTIVVE